MIRTLKSQYISFNDNQLYLKCDRYAYDAEDSNYDLSQNLNGVTKGEDKWLGKNLLNDVINFGLGFLKSALTVARKHLKKKSKVRFLGLS